MPRRTLPPPAVRPIGPSPADPDGSASDVLRYWLALLRHEEALGRRPKVRHNEARTVAEPNLADPVPGQQYAKVPFANASAFLTRQTQDHSVALNPEWTAFFEDWLLARYRRGDDEDEAELDLVSFPTVHLPRDELAGLLRFPVLLRWRNEKGAFSVPSPAERRRGSYPLPPSELTLICPSPGEHGNPDFDDDPGDAAENELPYFIDTRLLRETLRIDVERIDALFLELKERGPSGPRDVIHAVTRLIESQSLLEAGAELDENASLPVKERNVVTRDRPRTPLTDPQALLLSLLGAVTSRLAQIASKAKAYGVALVLRADSSRTTWHLQKDIEAAQELSEWGDLASSAPLLEAYLTGRKLSLSASTCWGRWHGPTLTNCQRDAAETAIGSQLCAVQGPPGTGKTTLILSMAAHALVSRTITLARDGLMGTGITVITSTNNRAVDNAVDPLSLAGNEGQLPLALRVGSRQVIDQVTREQLARARAWFESKTTTRDQAETQLKEELRQFRRLHDELKSQLGPLETYRTSLRQRAVLVQKLSHQLNQQGEKAAAASANHGFPTNPVVQDRAIRLLNGMLERLVTGSDLAEGSGKKVLRRVRRHFKLTQELFSARIEDALGRPLPTVLPPDPEPAAPDDALEAWLEGFEALIGEISVLLEAIEHAQSLDKQQKQIAEWTAELESLDSALLEPPPELDANTRMQLEKRHQELLVAALRVREAWALAHRSEVILALGRLIRATEVSRNLKKFVESERETMRWLFRLYPIWGTTLLSMGNAFLPEPGSIDTVIIDEAGQCHPAYAVSALFRAKRALVIGDTFQLEPVFEIREADEKRIRRTLALCIAAHSIEPYRCFEASTASAQRLADRAVEHRTTLVDHFRCQPQIAAISERLCGYGLVTQTPHRSRSSEAPFLTSPLLHWAVDGQQQRFAGSWYNEAELQHTMRLVRHLLTAGIAADEIGVITPYRGQLERLWRVFREARLPVERLWSDGEDTGLSDGGTRSLPGLALGTVHRFQGGERSIIILSMTLTRRDALSFVDGRVNLVNVAASRAKEHLVTIGHTPILRLGQHTRHLVEGVEELRLDAQ